MEEKIERVEELPLPVCMFRKHQHLRFWFTLVPILVLTLIGFIYIVRSQESETKWETWKFRVEFGEDPVLKSYSGCYQNDFDESTDLFKRDLYLSIDDARHEQTKAKFGFCNENRQWVYEDEHGNLTDPCEVEVVIIQMPLILRLFSSMTGSLPVTRRLISISLTMITWEQIFVADNT
mmetsp:Transcript_1827/g.4772  ORF Transcript_1827/g.4772 Transcript_1827/m.4772 type:complete len:178 (-) Transcript_1827:894-1427(-)